MEIRWISGLLLSSLAFSVPVAAQTHALRLPTGSEVVFPHDSIMNTTVPATMEAWIAAESGGTHFMPFLRYASSAEHKSLEVWPDARVKWLYAGQPWAHSGGCVETGPGVFPIDGAFHHLAFVRRSDGSWETFLDGVSIAAAGPGGCCWLTCNTINANAPSRVVGGDGWLIRGMRVSDSERYAGAFTPEDTWTPDGSTVMLVEFDEGQGSQVGDVGPANQIGTIRGGYEWVALGPDCNGNGVVDADDIASGFSSDCDLDGVPDECEIIADASLDCNGNGTLDVCDGALDCNGNGVPDECDIDDWTSEDCNQNGTPDECELEGNDCNGNSIPDDCDHCPGWGFCMDCDSNGIPDECDIAEGTHEDCNMNGVPDICDVIEGSSMDCNSNWIPDECEWADGTMTDLNGNGVPDQCECPVVAYCPPSANSVGDGVVLSTEGAACLNVNNLVIVAEGGPTGQPGLVFYGAGVAEQPFGNGVRCVGGPIYRIGPPVFFGGAGHAERVMDWTQGPTGSGPGAITAGSTWYFQLWYRDSAAGSWGFNLSNGLEITFGA
jgi:hypothetical protein